MRVLEGREEFKKLFPEMMKSTRLLLVDHDVTRYHSFDLIRYEIFRNRSLALTLQPEFYELVKPGVELQDQIHYLKTRARVFNVFDMFSGDSGVQTMKDYEDRLRVMLTDPIAKCTPTDVSRRFEIVFDRPGITGYLLQYKGDTNRPTCYDKMTVYEAESILDLNTAAAIVKKHKINAIMIGNAQVAISLGQRLVAEGYTSAISFIIANYRYNFIQQHGIFDGKVVPRFIPEMRKLELDYNYEFGHFDPFGSITFRVLHGDDIVKGDTIPHGTAD